jgi:hypothetical protein
MNYPKTNIDLSVENKIFDKLNILIGNKTFSNYLHINKEEHFFNNILSGIKNYLDRESYLHVCFFIRKYRLVLDELGNNNFDSAENHLTEINSLISDEPNIANLIVLTVANHVLAYKAYKYGNNNEVFSYLIKSLEIDCLLEEKGLALMHFHKIQTFHYISRAYLHQNSSSGITISLELLKYLSAATGNFRLGEFILLQEKNNLSPGLCRKLFLQIFNHLILYFVKNNDDNNAYFLEILRRNLSKIQQKESYLTLIEEWLILNLNKNPENNGINAVTRFLKLYRDKLVSSTVFIVKKTRTIYPSQMEVNRKIRTHTRSYKISI